MFTGLWEAWKFLCGAVGGFCVAWVLWCGVWDRATWYLYRRQALKNLQRQVRNQPVTWRCVGN